MADEFAAVIDAILEQEGWPRFTDDPDDRGGPTKGGITLETLTAWRGRPVTVEDLRALEEPEARSIYRERYIDGPRFAEVADPQLRSQVIDCGVLHGVDRAARWLQEAIGGVTVDGRVGRFTLGALATQDAHRVALLVCRARVKFIGRIIAVNYEQRRRGRTRTDQARFAGGWTDRATDTLEVEARIGCRPPAPLEEEVP